MRLVDAAGVDAWQSGGPRRSPAELMCRCQTVYRFEIGVIAEGQIVVDLWDWAW